MQTEKIPDRQHGAAAFEVLAAIVVLVLIAGAGAYVVHRDHNSSKTTNLGTLSSDGQATAAKPGTTSYIDEVTQQAAATEQNTDNSYDSQYQQAATSANTAMSNLGGAYNESTL